jgi:centromere protein S
METAPEDSTSTGVSRPTGKSSSVDSELRAAVQYAVIQLCSEDDENSSSRMSPRAIAALAELTCLYATHSLAADLEAFSSHAGRRTITEADVKLSARKIPEALMQRLNDFCDIHCTSNNNDNSKRKAKKIGAKAATVDLQGTKHKDFAYDVESDSSSSDEDTTMELDRPAPRRPPPVPVRKPAHDSLLDSDSDDEIQILGSLQSRLEKRKESVVVRPNADPLDTSDEDSKPRAATTVAAPPNRRFRLSATKRTTDHMCTDTEDEDDDILKDPFAKGKAAGGSATKSSLVRKILEDMDDDSVLSENAEKENDT